ncbi:MAG TPA: hypothetical protein PLF01_01490, partial [Alphaproteobacteria bacterium]|nr:hypothetical protein [Alphaproteobacteria bacterium]
MTKILYYCDLHQGPRKEATDQTDVLLNGHFAMDMNMAVMAYAATQKFDHVIHGGDESTFVLDPERADHHLQRAQIIQSTMNYTAGDLHRVIGNHDPIPHLDILGFKPQSY